MSCSGPYGTTPSSAPVAGTTATLLAPTNVQALGTQVDMVDVTWKQSANTTSCSVGYSLASGGPYQSIAQASTGYAAVTGLARGTT